MVTKAPTSLLSAIGLLTKRVWDRCLAKTIKGSPESASPEPSTTHSSPTTRFPLGWNSTSSSEGRGSGFPQEVTDMIAAHLIDDTRSLLACSLTSRSWYLAAVPHLHHTLITRVSYRGSSKKNEWPGPLQAASELGWCPFVRRLFITADWHQYFSPKAFCSSTQQEFSTLTNVQEFSIQYLNISSFIPEIQQYFGQFSQTLRSLTLQITKGSERQTVFFIRLFPHLEDLGLYPGGACSPEEPGDRTLVPPFVLPLRGRFKASFYRGDSLAKAMADLFGGVQFSHMDLMGMGGAQRLLYACADTLESFRLYATNLRDSNTLRDYDLSRNKSLRELTITAQSLITALRDRPPATTPSSLRAVLSTIKSPTFSKVVVVYRESNFYHSVYSSDAQAVLEGEAAWYRRQFDTYREMYKGRDFQLVLQASHVSDDSMRELERAVAAEKVRGGLPPALSVTFTLGAF